MKERQRQEERFGSEYDQEPGQNVVTHEQIARRAYELFESRGRQPGRETEDWIQAERELYGQVRRGPRGMPS